MMKLLKKILSVGLQFWWPVDIEYHEKTGGDWRIEVVVGSILTQNTKWEIVERTINLMKEELFEFSIDNIKRTNINSLISLFNRVPFKVRKANCLKNLIEVLECLTEKENLIEIRQELLKVKGIGKETADCIILYSFEKPIFVVDSYTRRILEKENLTLRIGKEYDLIREILEREINSSFNKLVETFKTLSKELEMEKVLTNRFGCKNLNKSPLNPFHLLCNNLDKEEVKVVLYKELHAMFDEYYKRNFRK